MHLDIAGQSLAIPVVINGLSQPIHLGCNRTAGAVGMVGMTIKLLFLVAESPLPP